MVVVNADAEGQMERNHGVATVVGGERLHIVARDAIGLVVPGVAAVLCLNSEFGVDGGVDHQSHNHRGVATVHILQRRGLHTGSAENNLVPGVGQFALADGPAVVRDVSLVDGENHCHHRVAAVGSLQGHTLCTGGIEGDAVPSIRQLARADAPGVAHGVGRVHSQGHRYHGVAAINGLQVQNL